MKTLILNSIIVIILYGCANTGYIADYTGHKVRIQTSTSDVFAELISVQDDELIIQLSDDKTNSNMNKPRIASVKNSKIESVTVSDLQNIYKDQILLFQILPALLIGLVGGSSTDEGSPTVSIAIAGVLMIPAFITYIIYSEATPEPFEWNNKMPSSLIYELRQYSRVQHQLSDDQIKELLSHYNQENIIKLK